MKLVVISDTHGYDRTFLKVYGTEYPYDMLIHAGDLQGSESWYSEMAGCGAVFYCCAGNNDFFSDAPNELTFMAGPCRVFLTHGHRYMVSMNPELIVQEAKDRRADILIYGHTHRPVAEVRNGILVVNPGSLTYPRQAGRLPTYAVINIDESGHVTSEIKIIE